MRAAFIECGSDFVILEVEAEQPNISSYYGQANSEKKTYIHQKEKALFFLETLQAKPDYSGQPFRAFGHRLVLLFRLLPLELGSRSKHRN